MLTSRLVEMKLSMRKRNIIPLAIASLLFLANIGAMAAISEPVFLSLDQAVREALSRNPRLVALGYARAAMRERPAQAAGLPNPMFTYRGMDATTGGAFPNTSEKRFEIEQPLPGYGKRGLREAVAVNEAGAMGVEAEVMAREVIWMVKEAAYELQAVQKAMRITRDEDDLLNRMAKVAEVRYAAGEAAQADAVKAQTETTMLQQKRLELEGREKTLRAKLAFLMSIDADQAPATIIAPLPDGAVPDPVALVKSALGKRAEIKAAQLKVYRRELQRKLMTRESQPDYKVGLEYRAIERQDDMVMFMVGVDLPLWRGKPRAAIREAGMMASASEADRMATERQVTLDVQSACYKVATARRTVELYQKDLIPQSAVRLQASEAGYRAGKVDFSDWLESQRFGLNVRIMAVMAEGELGSGWAALERAVGGSL
jgi:cobalt-zinc-cadmium efflux system outer membrane protein